MFDPLLGPQAYLEPARSNASAIEFSENKEIFNVVNFIFLFYDQLVFLFP